MVASPASQLDPSQGKFLRNSMEGRRPSMLWRPKCYSPTIYKLAWRLAQVEYIYIPNTPFMHILCINGIWKFSTHLHRLHQVSCLTPWIQWGKLHWTYETVFLLTFQYVIFGSTSYQCYTHTNDNNIIWLLRISRNFMVILIWC